MADKKQYQIKIDAMQKYVPFLTKLIAKMQQESENAAKVVQMELLHKILISPEPSVSIDELIKCEAVLEKLYESTSETNEVENDGEMDISSSTGVNQNTEDICKDNLELETKEESVMATLKDKDDISNDIEVEKNDDISTNIMREQNGTTNIKISNETTCNKEEIETKDMDKTCDEKIKAATEKENQKIHLPDPNTKHHEKDKEDGIQTEDITNIVNDTENPQDGKYEEGKDDIKIAAVASSQADAADIVENIELIGFPEEEGDEEMILPDSTEDDEKAEVEEEKEQQREEELTDEQLKQTINNAEVEISEEPELVALESVNASQDDMEKTEDGYDPLNCEETTKTTHQAADEESTDKLTNDTATLPEDDDDDVLLIETRNSPICIDSDDEDESAMNPAPILAAIPATVPPKERIFARKSTAKPAATAVPQILKKPKNLSYLLQPNLRPKRRRVVDTIELLDSSDEDDKNKPTTSSPAKRRLLPAIKHHNQYKSNKGNYPQPTGLHYKRTTNTASTPLPAPVYIPTPQSNFLNAVNLQPANTGSNPVAFSAQLSNKNVIIPNAFYGNPPEVRNRGRPRLNVSNNKQGENDTNVSENMQQDRSYRRWLQNFLTNFTNPQMIATHSCFVMLQRVLRFKLFTRIKDTRTQLNTMAHNSQEHVDIQLMLDLRNVFYTSGIQLSDVGRRFCELACTHMPGKSVTLTTDANTGRVTSRTRTSEEMALERSSNLSREAIINSTVSSPNFSGIFSANSGRKRPYDDSEYTPNKQIDLNTIVDGESSGERKKSLRRNRTRRFDESFTYNEDQGDDDLLEEDEVDESDAAVQRKIEQKRLEAKRQCEKQAKSFENAFIETFSKSISESGKVVNTNTALASSSSQSNNSNSYVQQYANFNTDFTNWIENNQPKDSTENKNDDDVLDDEPKQHRIYKVIPAKLTAAKNVNNKESKQKAQLEEIRRKRGRPKKNSSYEDQDNDEPEVITCDDGDDVCDDTTTTEDSSSCWTKDDDDVNSTKHIIRIDPTKATKNTDRTMHLQSKRSDWCIFCDRRVPRIVHHYVNEHRGCETYTSRLAESQVLKLRRNQGNIAQVSLYKNGQHQYEAPCVFCLKKSRFMLPYWYQHYAMHTGEYAYRCSGCGIRKPTRSLLTSHTNQPCAKGGAVIQDYNFDSKSSQIEARVCMLCNYVQLHRSNMVQHLRTQHNVQQILPKHIQIIVLLRKSTAAKTTTPIRVTVPPNTSKRVTTLHANEYDDGGGAVFEISEIDDPAAGSWAAEADTHQDDLQYFNYDDADTDNVVAPTVGQWVDESGDPNDDLSFMICGMLDVQMNTD